jgi:indole-3-glycerol phosphate synthase
LIDTVPDILARIVARKREELAGPRTSLKTLERQAGEMQGIRRDFRAALEAHRPAIIAEMKKASPSRGVLSTDFNPADLAREYEMGGAAALSVLTDASFFQGSLTHLGEAREASVLPVLRKDFTVEEYHVTEAAAHGADAILLIAAILETGRIRELRELAARYQMNALVEVHTAAELESALAAGADIIGVNNRDLKTFKVTLETSLRLVDRIPAGVVKVAESGIGSPGDIRRLSDAGFDAFLVGEHLMQSAKPSEALRALMSGS